jgi:hypothetical protein
MITPEDDSDTLRKASYAAYTEAVRGAYRVLSNSITEYFDERRKLHDNEILHVPENFRPLKDYERTLKIQNLTLRLALGTAELNEQDVVNSIRLPVHANGSSASP